MDSDTVITEKQTKSEEEFTPPPPEKHVRELIECLDNEELHKKWDKEMENAKEPIRSAYKKLPVYKRLKVLSPSSGEWLYGIIASMHNLEDLGDVAFSVYAWSGEDNTFTAFLYTMEQFALNDILKVLDEEEYEDYNQSVKQLNLYKNDEAGKK